MRIDLYTKVVLTVIAVALMGIFANSFFRPSPVSAQSPSFDYSRLSVAANATQVVVFNNLTGDLDVLDLKTGRHISTWRIENPAFNLAGGN